VGGVASGLNHPLASEQPSPTLHTVTVNLRSNFKTLTQKLYFWYGHVIGGFLNI
jgi:hypothetical protein